MSHEMEQRTQAHLNDEVSHRCSLCISQSIYIWIVTSWLPYDGLNDLLRRMSDTYMDYPIACSCLWYSDVGSLDRLCS